MRRLKANFWKAATIPAVVLVTVLAAAPPSYAASWTVVPSPNASVEDWLTGLAAFSPADLWSAGTAYRTNGTDSSSGLIEQYNGTSWQIVSAPSPTGCVYCSLSGVAGSSASDVWAVGEEFFNKADYGALIEHYNGSAWSLVSAPTPTYNGYLSGVTSLSPSNAWAVGGMYYDGPEGPLVEHYNGTAWSISSTASVPGGLLTAVTAVSASDIWAIGTDPDAGTGIVMNYNGTSWTQTSVPAPSGTDWELTGISADSASDVWAVGFTYNDLATADGVQPIVEHYNGTSWTLSYLPIPSGYTYAAIANVLAISSTDIWATGYSTTSTPGAADVALFEQYNGTSWTIEPSPSLSGYALGFDGMANVDGALWAVGNKTPLPEGLNQTATATLP
jgi:hypothetical protein